MLLLFHNVASGCKSISSYQYLKNIISSINAVMSITGKYGKLTQALKIYQSNLE